jgi:glycosyltransferase involved in cell wall biosynthesis
MIAPLPPSTYKVALRIQNPRQPEAAVIIPAFERAHLIEQTLASVVAQQEVELELIVVDDASGDDTLARVVTFVTAHQGRFAQALVLRHEQRAGPAAARDTGMRNLTSDAALLLDSDNLLYPRCLRRCLDALHACDAAYVYPILRVFGNRQGLLSAFPFDAERLARRNYIDTLVLMRHAAWQALGGFPHLALGHEDHACWLALLERGLVGAQVPEILAEYRDHRASRTAHAALHQAEIEQMVRQAFGQTTSS